MIVGRTSTPRPRFINKIQTNCQYNKPFLLQIEYYITMSVSNVLILSIVNPDVVGGWAVKTAPVLPISFEFGTNRYQIHLHYSLLSHENYFHWLIQCQQKAIRHFYWLTDMVRTCLPRAQRVITDALGYIRTQ